MTIDDNITILNLKDLWKMFTRVEVDGASSDYKSSLLTIYNQLRNSEFQSMKFLCSDIISDAKMEQFQNVLELFQELEKLGKIGEPNNFMMIAEMLLHIGRSDQLKTLNLTKEMIAGIVAESPTLDPFRVLLFKVSEQLTSDETKMLIFIYGAKLPRSKKEIIKNPEELFLTLERHGVSLKSDPNSITGMMKSINRTDLVKMIQKYYERIKFNRCSDDDKTIYCNQKLDSTLNVSLRDSSRFRVERDPVNKRTAIAQRNDFGLRREMPSCEDNNATCHRSNIVALMEDEHFDLPCYPMTRTPRGYCLIINNEVFSSVPGDQTSRAMPNREGTQRDAEMLEYLFRQKLNFKVIVRPNLTAEEISKKMADMAFNVDHSPYDCFVCCILSHGVLGSVYGVDGRTVEIKNLMNFYKGASCPSLLGKPKLFFIQACQGKDKQPGFPISTDGPESIAAERVSDEVNLGETIPNEADFLIGYATVPGYVSFRSKSQGSWYINTLVKMLDKYVERYDLLSILIKVNEEVSRAIAAMQDGIYKQSPMPMATLRKRIFFR